MDIKIGNRITFDIAIRDSNRALVTDLATASAVKYMIKENATDLDASALISKNLSAGITVNMPSLGYIRVVILPADWVNIEPGQKYHGLQIEYSATNVIEVNLSDNNQVSDKINLVQDVVR